MMLHIFLKSPDLDLMRSLFVYFALAQVNCKVYEKVRVNPTWKDFDLNSPPFSCVTVCMYVKKLNLKYFPV